MNPYVMYDNIVPGIAPVDTAATAISTQYIDMATAHSVAFLAYFGNIATTSTDEVVTVTVEGATVQAGTSASAVAFKYRLSGVADANTWGAVTAATTAGVSIASTDDGKMLWVELDPGAVQTAKADARWVRLTVTPAAGGTATLVSAVGLVSPRYRGATMVSTT